MLVTSKGVEPPTAGAEIQCSIQLSYEAFIKENRVKIKEERLQSFLPYLCTIFLF